MLVTASAREAEGLQLKTDEKMYPTWSLATPWLVKLPEGPAHIHMSPIRFERQFGYPVVLLCFQHANVNSQGES